MASDPTADSSRRTVFRRLIIGGTAACAAVAVVAVVLWPDPDDSMAGPVERLAPAGAALSLDSVTYDWQATPAPFSWDGMVDHQGRRTGQVGSGGIIYVLSSAPGARADRFGADRPPKAIYASPDGVTWEAHRVGGDWIDSIAASDGKLHGIGTVPGIEDGSMVIQVGASGDHGATFTPAILPFGRVDEGTVDTRLLATGSSVLALVTLTRQISLMSLMPPEVQAAGGYLLLTSERIGVFSAEIVALADLACFSGDPGGWGQQPECLTYFESDAVYVTTWEELGRPELAPASGVDGRGLPLGEETIRGAYLSVGGGTFQEVDFPFLPGWIDMVFNVGDIAVASVSGMEARLWGSDDLQNWRPIAPEVEASWFMDIGEVAGEYVLVGGADDGPVVYRTDDLFGEWSEVDVGSILPAFDDPGSPMWLETAAVGVGGVGISIGGTNDGSGSNPVTELIDRVIPRRPVAAAAPEDLNLLFVSRDLAHWDLVSPEDLGGLVEQLFFSSRGDLVAVVRDHQGRPVNMVAQP